MPGKNDNDTRDQEEQIGVSIDVGETTGDRQTRETTEENEKLDEQNKKQAKKSPMSTGPNAKPLQLSKAEQENEADKAELKKRRKSIQALMDQVAPGNSADSVIGSLNHLNNLNEQALAFKALLETIETFLKIMLSTEYFLVQRNLYNKAKEQGNAYTEGMPIYRFDEDGNKTMLLSPKDITREDIILNGYVPEPDIGAALATELAKYSNHMLDLDLKHDHNILKGYSANREKQMKQEKNDADLTVVNPPPKPTAN